jgi:hypothetical protein
MMKKVLCHFATSSFFTISSLQLLTAATGIKPLNLWMMNQVFYHCTTAAGKHKHNLSDFCYFLCPGVTIGRFISTPRGWEYECSNNVLPPLASISVIFFDFVLFSLPHCHHQPLDSNP